MPIESNLFLDVIIILTGAFLGHRLTAAAVAQVVGISTNGPAFLSDSQVPTTTPPVQLDRRPSPCYRSCRERPSAPRNPVPMFGQVFACSRSTPARAENFSLFVHTWIAS